MRIRHSLRAKLPETPNEPPRLLLRHLLSPTRRIHGRLSRPVERLHGPLEPLAVTRRTKQARALLLQIELIDGRIAHHKVRMEHMQSAIDELLLLRRQLADALQEGERAVQKG